MADRARIFKTGGSQAVRLPKKYRFEGQTEVVVRREGDRVILEPVERSWSQTFLELAGSLPEFPKAPKSPPPEPVPDLD